MEPNDRGRASAGPTTDSATDSAAEDASHYTGVVVIHGLGDEERNSTLMEYVNALTFWFNHKAGLALRPTGPGRVWLSTQLTEKEDPDAPASRASIELEAPAASPDGAPGDAPLRLEFREVWWAQSFGIQPLGTTIRWARVQAREQVRHILIPVGRQLRRAPTAPPLPSAGDEAIAPAASPATRSRRRLLRTLLAIYGGIQAAWKIVQWLVLTPIVLGLLVLISALQVFSFIGFIRSALVNSFNALTSYVMLHWIASTQVYMRDYSLSTEIRQRFEREVAAFLRDVRCDRVVVIAYSMGTVIAYEGLTTLLSEPESQSEDKPITFICLAQALRRVWLLPGIDARRLHGVLPERVRWIHFWARYDPVAAGPLTARVLPPLDKWSDADAPDPSAAIRASLDRCENIVVANTDSSFTDHASYSTNMEQVVGPIAQELVLDHPALEEVARSHLATHDDVLRRRWSIAWRYMLALAAGTLAGGGVMVWQILNQGLSKNVATFIRNINWGGVVGSICPPCQAITSIPKLPPPPPELTSPQLSHYFAFWYYLTLPETGVLAVAAVLALIAGTIGMQGIGHFVARSSPLDAPVATETRAGGTNWVFVLSAATLALALAVSLIFTTFIGTHVTRGQVGETPVVTIFSVTLAVAELANGIAFWAAVVDALSNRLWSWCAFLVLALLLCYTFDPYYRSALLGIAVVGCVVTLFGLARQRRSGMYWAVGLQMLVILYIGIGALAADVRVTATGAPGTGAYIESVMPSFLYGLWSVTTRRNSPSRALPTGTPSILGLAAIYLALFYSLSLSLFGSALVVLPNFGLNPIQRIPHTQAPVGALALGDVRVWVAVGVALFALALGLVDAARSRRWIWLAAMPLVLTGLAALLVLLRVGVGVEPVLRDDALAFSLAPLATALIYSLWAGAGPEVQRKPRLTVTMPAPPS